MDYKELELYGRPIRYYDETHIEMEFRNIKDNWRKKPISIRSGYLSYHIKANGKTNYVSIHRLVFYAHNPKWDIYNSSLDNSIDHINNTPADNRIENLRCVSNQENQWNRPGSNGYCWHKHKKKWCASITVSYYLGQFDSEEDAKSAYLTAKAKYHVITTKNFV